MKVSLHAQCVTTVVCWSRVILLHFFQFFSFVLCYSSNLDVSFRSRSTDLDYFRSGFRCLKGLNFKH